MAERRLAIVEALRTGDSQRSVAARFGVGLGTVQRAAARAISTELGDVDWADRSTAPHRTRRTAPVTEEAVLAIRAELAAGILGECGALAIREALLQRGLSGVPSLRTVGRILERSGILDGRRRIRRRAPPRGWYIPALAAREAELDSFDVVTGLRLQGGAHLEALTGISVHGGLPGAWTGASMASRATRAALIEHWAAFGLPGFAQFDNDTRFLGSHGRTDVVGTVPRLCLALGVTPVFAPIREMGFQGAIEAFNGRWQARVWDRYWSTDAGDLQAQSDRYIAALRVRGAGRIEAAPPRRPFAGTLPPPESGRPHGQIIFVRRLDDAGRASILERHYPVDSGWSNRLVRAELDLDALALRFYRLRRREPVDQPLLAQLPYVLPTRRAWVTRRY